MPECRCNECAFCRVIRGRQRGVMDCDPDEWYCSENQDDFFFTEWDYDEDEDEVIECPEFRDGYDYWYPDFQFRRRATYGRQKQHSQKINI